MVRRVLAAGAEKKSVYLSHSLTRSRYDFVIVSVAYKLCLPEQFRTIGKRRYIQRM